ncbi:phosphoenolpyruvate carboxylase [Stenotrophomonas maltophilia]
MDYFRTATPIDVIERMTLGSRPSRRLGQDAALGNLRAIPWVFAWSRRGRSSRAGTAWAVACRRPWMPVTRVPLREMARDWPFFRTFLDDIAMVLSKGDITIAEQFSQLSGELHGRFFPQVQRELELTRHWLLALMDQQTLLDHDARLALSIRLRNPYVDPISVLQVDLLQRWRASGREDDDLLRALVACVNGVSQGVQNTG